MRAEADDRNHHTSTEEDAMSEGSKPQRSAATPKRGEAAWRAERDAIAARNEAASRKARARRQAKYDEETARRAAADRRERAELAKRTR
jgi:hypothetical protein